MSKKLDRTALRARQRRITKMYLAGLFLLVFFLILAPYILVFVEAGEAAVLFRRFFGGVVTTRVYGEGMHIIFPWDQMSVYDVRIQEKSIKYQVLTENGLSVDVDLSIRYHPEYQTLGILHQRVGPDYLNKVIIPVVEGAVRKSAGRYAAEDLYSSQGALLQEIESEVRSQIGQYFVNVDGLVIKRLILPQAIQKAIEHKEEQRELLESYQYRLSKEKEEAVRKQIEAIGWSNFNVIVGKSISQRLLQWRGIEATSELAKSTNSKVVIIGNGADGMPVILGSDYTAGGPATQTEPTTQMPSSTMGVSEIEEQVSSLRSLFNRLILQNRPDPNSASKPLPDAQSQALTLLEEAVQAASDTESNPADPSPQSTPDTAPSLSGRRN